MRFWWPDSFYNDPGRYTVKTDIYIIGLITFIKFLSVSVNKINNQIAYRVCFIPTDICFKPAVFNFDWIYIVKDNFVYFTSTSMRKNKRVIMVKRIREQSWTNWMIEMWMKYVK